MSEIKIESPQVFKSKPRPILKKNSSNRQRVPLFFSGNEVNFENKDNQNDNESIHHLNILTNTVHHTDIYLTCEEVRFGKSQLPHCKPKSLHKRRALSSVYIFHSREIDREIINNLLMSTQVFIEKLKISLKAEKLNDQEFYRNFKSKIVYGFREFLLNTNTHHPFSQNNQIGVSLSEPCISQLENYRIKNKLDRIRDSESSSRIQKTFIAANVDIYGKQNENLIDPISASLPNSSFLEAYSKQIKLRENVFLKSLRSNSLDNSDVIDIDFNNSSQNTSIISNATTSKKIVRFADSFGLELENVKIITNNSFVEAFSQSNDEPIEEMGFDKLLKTDSNPFIVLIPLFSVRKNFDTNVKLDDYHFDYQNRIIKCIVKVKNVCYEKRVFARITFNNWKNFYDLDAIYTKSDMQSNNVSRNNETRPKGSFLYDYFGFCIILPEKQNIIDNETEKQIGLEERKLRVEFALCFETRLDTFWDNNCGENYKFQCFYNITH